MLLPLNLLHYGHSGSTLTVDSLYTLLRPCFYDIYAAFRLHVSSRSIFLHFSRAFMLCIIGCI